MPHVIVVEGRTIPIRNFHQYAPTRVGVPPEAGVHPDVAAEMDREMARMNIRPPRRATFVSEELIPDGARGAILEDNAPIGTVTVESCVQENGIFNVSGKFE